MNELLLALADDELVLGWRDSEWTGIAPVLEEIRGNGYWIDEAIVQACLRQAGEA